MGETEGEGMRTKEKVGSEGGVGGCGEQESGGGKQKKEERQLLPFVQVFLLTCRNDGEDKAETCARFFLCLLLCCAFFLAVSFDTLSFALPFALPSDWPMTLCFNARALNSLRDVEFAHVGYASH